MRRAHAWSAVASPTTAMVSLSGPYQRAKKSSSSRRPCSAAGLRALCERGSFCTHVLQEQPQILEHPVDNDLIQVMHSIRSSRGA
jgi:hypothetical protein